MLGMNSESVMEFDPSRIAVPTLLLHGDDDRLVPVGVSKYLATRIPDARLIEHPGASHMLPVTHAREIAGEIVAFGQ
jgi:pimeloyl-ACP methyl ester carboxylesterase